MNPTSDFYPSWAEMKLGRLDPAFVIPEGTAVVTIVDRKVPGSTRIKRAGSRGKIERSPIDNAYAYLVAFDDGAKLFFKQRELALAESRELRDELADETTDYSAFVIFAARVGPKTFGLAGAVPHDRADSVRGIFLPPAVNDWSLFRAPEQIQRIDGTADELYWELEKFLRLAIEGHPPTLEALHSPKIETDSDWSRELRGIRTAFVSAELGKAYSSFVLGQFKKMDAEHAQSATLDYVRVADLIRQLHAGRITLFSGEFVADVMEYRAELSDIIHGRWDINRIRERVWALERELRRAIEISPLPKRPDLETIDGFLIRARAAQAKKFLSP